jgi:2-polyprenyl-3-methyl-5-hydroxy-6-metoxy-1,4-benzoquinol methylase
MPRLPYKMYHPAAEVHALDTHGQSWQGETVQENIDLCPSQTIEPVFRHFLPREGKILEAGCGLGRWVFYLGKMGFDITGIDMAEAALRAARAYDPKAPIRSDDILHTSYPDASFDAVISLGVVEHFEEGPGVAFAETWRLLKPGGLFFVTIPTQNLSRLLVANRLKELKRRLNQRKGTKYVFEEYRYTRKEFQSLLRQAGFVVEAVVPDDFRLPMNIGLYVDYPFLRHRTRKWELNGPGMLVERILRSLSPWSTTSGTMWVCRKSPG